MPGTTPRILITTGPECCGKTTIAGQLSACLGAPLVSEVSRDYLTSRYAQEPDYRYTERDLLEIARLQHAHELRALTQGPRYLVCDTDLLVIVIWSEVVFGSSSPQLQALFEHSCLTSNRTYILCDTGIAWQADPLRENPHDRESLFVRYKEKLEYYGLEHLTVSGSEAERLQQVQRHCHLTAYSQEVP